MKDVFSLNGLRVQLYYMAMDFDNVVNPASDKILRTYDLIRAMPDVFWSSGKAGVELAPEFAEKLEALWKKHLEGLK